MSAARANWPFQKAISLAHLLRRSLTPFMIRNYDKLHLGAGPRYIPGWANLDLWGRKNLIWDLTHPLPVKRGSVRYVYTEHFVEHISRSDCLKLLRNCRASMASDGVLRISTPDLRQFAECYLRGEIPPGWGEQPPSRAFNELTRAWGHTYIYDEADLTSLLHEAGFRRVKRVEHGVSEHPALHALEQRESQMDLIVEAQP